MDRYLQLLLPMDQTTEAMLFSPQDREEVIEAVADLLLQILSVEEEREDENDLVWSRPHYP